MPLQAVLLRRIPPGKNSILESAIFMIKPNEPGSRRLQKTNLIAGIVKLPTISQRVENSQDSHRIGW